MLGVFTDPFPDELLYSACARLQDRVRPPSSIRFLQELFGTRSARPVVDLPSHLAALVSVLPTTYYTVDRLIDHHTLLPFYTPFLPPARVSHLRREMAGSHGGAIHMRIGIMASRIQPDPFLKFCPVCIANDVAAHGDPYWHRVHQIPGVLVCPLHRVFLAKSATSIKSGSVTFLLASQNVRPAPPRPLDDTDPAHRLLLEIARDAAWLLAHPESRRHPHTLRARYRTLLAEHGLAAYAGPVRPGEFARAFTQWYPETRLQQLGWPIQVPARTVAARLYRLFRSSTQCQHPLWHLLLIHFLGHSADGFFNRPTAPAPFGAGPWPCLNSAAAHYRQFTIRTCQVTRDQQGHPLGTFACRCGFIYHRTGPDRSPEDRFRRTGTVKAFGPVWETALRRLWADSSLSLSQIARQLGVIKLTVKDHANRLGLSFPREGAGRVTQGGPVYPPSPRLKRTASKKDKARYRQSWLATLKQNPEAGLTRLRNTHYRVYAWLNRYDGRWLKAHCPPRHSESIRQGSPTDWKKRDAQLARKVTTTARRLRDAPGRPRRITTALIGHELNTSLLVRSRLTKLPRTTVALARAADTRETYAVRRIRWAAEEFRREGIWPKRWKLIRRAGLRPDLVGAPKIKQVLDSMSNIPGVVQ